jgi:hypothetical protein
MSCKQSVIIIDVKNGPKRRISNLSLGEAGNLSPETGISGRHPDPADGLITRLSLSWSAAEFSLWCKASPLRVVH